MFIIFASRFQFGHQLYYKDPSSYTFSNGSYLKILPYPSQDLAV